MTSDPTEYMQALAAYNQARIKVERAALNHVKDRTQDLFLTASAINIHATQDWENGEWVNHLHLQGVWLLPGDFIDCGKEFDILDDYFITDGILDVLLEVSPELAGWDLIEF